MRHKIIFSLALLTLTFLNACKQEKGQDVISKAKMSQILLGQHVLEAEVLLLKLRTDSMNKVYNSLELELFEKHGVTRQEYEKSYGYYMTLPEEMDKIYDAVVDSLNVMDQEATVRVEEEEKEKQRLKDSLKAARDSVRVTQDSLKALPDSVLLELNYQLIGDSLVMKEDSVAVSDADTVELQAVDSAAVLQSQPVRRDSFRRQQINKMVKPMKREN